MLFLLLILSLARGAEWPSVDEPVKGSVPHPEDAALVIGIEDYYELPDVLYAERDAKLFRDFLVYSRGVPPGRVELLDTPSRTSAAKIRAAVKRLGESVAAGGTAWIYFAGHGAASPVTTERVLMGVTTSPDTEVFLDGSVTVAELESAATAGGGNAFLVLDTCYAGAGVTDAKRFAVPSYAKEKRAQIGTWTAAEANQLSGPIPAVKHGAFTYFSVGALRGWADGVLGAPDGKVTAEEAQEYVAQALAAVQIRDQRPVMAVGAASDWVLSDEALQPGPSLAELNIRAPSAAPAGAPVTGHVTLSYRVQATHSGGGSFQHQSGQPLSSGDFVSFSLFTAAPTYVYVLLMSSTGEASQIFPNPQIAVANPLPSGREVLIPPQGAFELDGNAGTETLHLVASSHPLPDIEARLAGLEQQGGGQAFLKSVGSLLCDDAELSTTAVACGGVKGRGMSLNTSANHVAGAPQVTTFASAPGDDVVVIQHQIDHR